MQLLYSYIKKEDTSLAELERDLLKSIDKSTDLYYSVLLLLTEIRRKAFLKIDSARNRRFVSEADLHPNTRFIDNPVFSLIGNNRKFKSYILNQKISWNENPEVINALYNLITESASYLQYMNTPEVTFEDHKEFLSDIFVNIIAQNELFYQTLEDKNIFWNDDFDLVLGIVYKTIGNLKEKNTEEDNIFYPVYNIREDTEFAKILLRKTVLENNENIQIIDKFTFNWEIERISDMDKLIMSIAITELKHFPSIPVKVTLDEYIELSKSYSSPKSGAFINGILDKAVALLKERNQLNKSGRGLME